MRIAWLAAATLVLGACQGTAFEKPPVAETACDAGLVGHWDSVDENAADAGDAQLDISDSCRLQLSERKNGTLRRGEPTQLHVGRLGAHGYLWVDGAWSQKQFDSETEVRPGDVFLVRYQLNGSDLAMQSPDDKAIAHRIIDDEIPGQTIKNNKGLQNRITGGPHPQLLGLPGFFREQPMRFRRTDGKAKP